MSDTEPKSDKRSSVWAKAWKPVLLVVVIVGLMILAKTLGLGEKLESMKGWIEGLGAWGPVAFILIYIVSTVAMVPGTALTLGAGALFGSVMGVVYVSIASTIGATCCFFIARYIARSSVTDWLGGNEKFQKMESMTKKHGVVILAIARLVPLFPFNLLNYGFGLTAVPMGTYILWSWICMLPGTILYVVGADAVTTAVAEGRVPWMLVGVLAVVVVFLAVIVRLAKGKLGDTETGKVEDK